MIKFTILLRRLPALTQQQFIAYHRDQHAALFLSLPEVKQYVRGYVQSHSTGDEIPGLPPMTFDGASELWFDDMAGLAGVFGAKECMDEIRLDESKFVDTQRSEFMLTTDNVVLLKATI